MYPEYKINNHHQRHGDYQTWCMYVPREEVERAMREIMTGEIRPCT